MPQRTSRFEYGVFPEPGDQAAEQELLDQAHPCVRRHLEGAHLDQPEPAAAVSGE